MHPNGPLKPKRKALGDMCYICGTIRCPGCDSPEVEAARRIQAAKDEKQLRHEESVMRQRMKLRRLPPRK